jgi:hypothetical protein
MKNTRGVFIGLALAIAIPALAYNYFVPGGALTGNATSQTVNLSSGAFITGDLPATNGGTGQTAITVGDVLYGSATNVLSRLAGNTTSTRQFFSQTGNGSISAAPAWGALSSADIPSLGATPTGTVGLSIAAGTATTYARSDANFALLLSIAPTWTGVHTFSEAPASNTSTDGIVLSDTTPAPSSGNQQFSPRLRLTGQGWKTNTTAGSQSVDWIIENQPVQGGASPTTRLAFSSSINGGAFSSRGLIDSAISGGGLSIGTVSVSGAGPSGNCIYQPASNTLGFCTNGALRGIFDGSNNFVPYNGANATATGDTNGFLYLPTVAGVPTGVPASLTGTYANQTPFRYDSTDDRLYAYNTSWKNIAQAQSNLTYQPGLLTTVVTTKSAFYKVVKASTVDNIEGSSSTFTCTANPTITVYECGTDATCATPTTIGSVTVTAGGQAFDGTVNSAAIAATHYVAWAISAGTCTAVDLAATLQLHSN